MPIWYAKYSIRTNQLYFTEEMISENRSRRNTKAVLMNFVRTEKNKMRIFGSFFILFDFAFTSMCDYQGSAAVRSLRMYMHSLRMASRVSSQP